MKSIKDHLTEFKANGLTIFTSVINADWVLQMRDTFDDLSSRIKNNNDKPTSAFTDVLEHKPELVLSVIDKLAPNEIIRVEGVQEDITFVLPEEFRDDVSNVPAS